MSIHAALEQLHVEANGVKLRGGSGRQQQCVRVGLASSSHWQRHDPGSGDGAAGSALGASEGRGKTPACRTGRPGVPLSAREGARRPGEHHAQRAVCVVGRSIG
jgi:hypothetical protein